jgi:iron complex outermembrane receptor protein
MKKSIRLRARALARFSAPALSVLSLAMAASVQAQGIEVNPIVVSATRMPQDPRLLPQGVQVITAKDIQDSGAATANEALRWIGGIPGRIDSSGGRDQTLDLRGFGAAASSNVVILVDGVRQNEGDTGGGGLSWIPVDSIERIEILRGSGSVLYGEGATGGVINVITSKGTGEPGGIVSFGAGNLGTTDARATLRAGHGSMRYQLSANAFDTDNHRNNFGNRERNLVGRATWAEAQSLLSVQLANQTTTGGLPGGLTVSDFNQSPKKAYKLNDNGKTETNSILLNGETLMGDWHMATDFNRKLLQVESNYVADSYFSKNQTAFNRMGVRGWNEFSTNGLKHRMLLGVDSEQWEQIQASNYDRAAINQKSDAAYSRYEVTSQALGAKAFIGARRTLSERDASGDRAGKLQINNTSWETGGAVKTSDKAEIFARLGTSFRLANADEFSCSTYYCPVNTVNMLKPQTSRDVEVGYRREQTWGRWSAHFYQHDLTDEIGLAADNMSNINYDPTRRKGIEVDMSASMSASWTTGLQYANRRATFRDGVYAGKDVPMVPQQTMTVRSIHKLSSAQTLMIAAQWVSEQRVTGDFDNTCADKIPSYGMVNTRYSQQLDSWTLSAGFNNLFDKSYYNYRTRCNPTAKSVYPEAGRTFMVTAQNRF